MKRTVYDYVSVHETLADDVAFVARSLGLGAYVAPCKKMCQTGAVGDCWRVKISGDTDMIPCRVPHKQADPRRQKKDVTNVGFTVELLGDGEYRGIALDGDHLYLLADFTVTHNTVLGYHAAYVVGRKTLVITTKDDIYKQWIDGAKKFLGLPDHLIGEIRGDKCEVNGTAFVVAMIHSLSKDGKYPDWITKGFGLVIFDECHIGAGRPILDGGRHVSCQVAPRPFSDARRADGKELMVHAHIGPLRAKTEAQLMVPKVLRFRSDWQCPRVLRTDKETGEQDVVACRISPARRPISRRCWCRQRAQPHGRAAGAPDLRQGPQARRLLDPDRTPEGDPWRLPRGGGIIGPQDGLLPRRDHQGVRRISASARRSSRSCSRPTR